MDSIDIHSIMFFQWCPTNVWLPIFFRISSSFVFSRRNKFIQVWNNLRVRKWWQNFNFGVNYPFKIFSERLKRVKNGNLIKGKIRNNFSYLFRQIFFFSCFKQKHTHFSGVLFVNQMAFHLRCQIALMCKSETVPGYLSLIKSAK